MNRIEQWCSSGLHGTVRNAKRDDKDKWDKKEREKRHRRDDENK